MFIFFCLALQIFRGTTDVHHDIIEMKNEYKQQLAEPKWSFKKLFTTKSLRLPLLIVCALACAQQLSGINVVSIRFPSLYLVKYLLKELYHRRVFIQVCLQIDPESFEWGLLPRSVALKWNPQRRMIIGELNRLCSTIQAWRYFWR